MQGSKLYGLVVIDKINIAQEVKLIREEDIIWFTINRKPILHDLIKFIKIPSVIRYVK